MPQPAFDMNGKPLPGMVVNKLGRKAYKIIGVAAGVTVEWTSSHAPPEAFLCNAGKRRKVDFVIRYYPSYKGWAVLDIRRAYQRELSNGRRYWWGQTRWRRYYPSEDAAVMAAMHQTGTLPAV